MVNTSKAIIVGHNSLHNWAGFNNWWQRKSQQIWLLQKRVFRLQLVCLLWPQWEQQHRRPQSFCTNTSTPLHSHTQKDVLGAFYIPFHLRPQIHPYVITCIEEWSRAASVVFCNRSFRQATVLPRAAMSQHEQPAWLASWDGRAQKNKPIVELPEHMACLPTASWGKKEGKIQSDF